MKKILFVLYFIFSVVFAFSTEIDTLAELKSELAAGGTHTLKTNTDGGSGGVYTLDANIIVNDNLTVTLDGSSDVVIDGDDTFYISMTASDDTVVFSGLSDTAQIKFQKMVAGLRHTYASGTGDYTYNYCEFTDMAANVNCVRADSAFSAIATITCNNCYFHDSFGDGFSLESTAITSDLIGRVNNCIFDNIGNSANDAYGDAVTAHLSNHYLYVTGCTFTDNDKSGIAIIDGATAYVKDCSFVDNDVNNSSSGQIQIGKISATAGLCSIYVEGCYFGFTSVTTKPHIRSFETGVAPDSFLINMDFDACLFNCENTTVDAFLFANAATVYNILNMNNCIWYNQPAAEEESYLLATTTAHLALKATNCIFDGGYRLIDIIGRQVAIKNTIFKDATSYGIVIRTANSYNYNYLNRLNDYYNNTADLFTDTVNSGDIDINPDLDGSYQVKSGQLKEVGSPIIIDSSLNSIQNNDIGVYRKSTGISDRNRLNDGRL